MGWPHIHWLARDLGWAGGSHCVSLVHEEMNEYAVGAQVGSVVGGAAHQRLALTGPFADLVIWYEC